MLQAVRTGWLLGLFLALAPQAASAGFFSISERDEIAIGRQAAVKVEQQLQLLRDDVVQSYITQLGLELARASARPHLPWRFRVIRDQSINAFALPGGFVYVHSGVLTAANSEAELAGVLAHEIGHIEGFHHKAQIERAMRYQFGLGILGAVLGQGKGADYALIAGRLLAAGELTKYSRAAERDADRRGVALLYRVGFDPLAMSRFLQQLLRLEQEQRDLLSDFFASHPAAGERVATTRTMALQLPQRRWRGSSRTFLRIRRRLHGGVEKREEGARIGGGAEGARITPLPRAPLGGARIRPKWE